MNTQLANRPKTSKPKSVLKAKEKEDSEQKQSDNSVSFLAMMSHKSRDYRRDDRRDDRRRRNSRSASPRRSSASSSSSSSSSSLYGERGITTEERDRLMTRLSSPRTIFELVTYIRELTKLTADQLYYKKRRQPQSLNDMAIIITSVYYDLSIVMLRKWDRSEFDSIALRVALPQVQLFLFRHAQGFASMEVAKHKPATNTAGSASDITSSSSSTSTSSSAAAAPLAMTLKPFATELGTDTLTACLDHMNDALGTKLVTDDLLPPLVAEASAIHLQRQTFTMDLEHLIPKGM